jgi:hypothetical protein
LKSAGWAAIAVAFVASVAPAEASAQGRSRADRASQERDGGSRADAGRQRNATEARGQRDQQANAQRERQTQRAVEQRSAQPANRGQQIAQSDRRGSPQSRPILRADQGQQAERNRGYSDPNRNGSYTPRRDNDAARDGRRGNDRNTSWQGNRDGNDWRGNRGESDRDRDGTWRRDRSDNDWRNDRRDDDRWRGDSRRWDRNWRHDHRYDWNRYRNTNRVVFRIGTYYAPYRNYSYRRFGIGARIGSLFYGSSYWLNDPWHYRLPAVYGPYRWVRYYDDVLLVDIYTGQVVDVIYDFFW